MRTVHQLKSRFPADGGLIDRWDKALSTVIFHLEIGFLELPLSTVGMWFGVPVVALVFVPTFLVLVLTAAAESTVFYVFVGFAALFLTSGWCYCIHEGKIMSLYHVPRNILLFLIVCSHCTCSTLVPEANSLVSFYHSSYIFTQTFVLALKNVCRRRRPGLALHTQLENRERWIEEINYFGRKGFTMFEAFPSGDTAGSAVCAYALYRVTENSAYFVLIFLSAFGRMYFWAHHLLDVIVGGSFACFACWFLEYTLGSWQGFSSLHSVLMSIAFTLVAPMIMKLRVPLPKHMLDPTGIEPASLMPNKERTD
jgi:membrane-associated phospholipid phosphatase